MPDPITTRCCIAGGGPAGMMLGFLLARAGVGVVVLEKHADFLRDFRGDTIHPSTLEIMHELGLLEAFLGLPHQKLRTLAGLVGDTRVTLADFTHLPTRCKFVALMPQWDFLNFMAERAKTYPAFKLMMRAEAMDLLFRVPDRGSGNPTPLGGMGLGSCANAAGTSTCRPAAATSPTRSGPRTATPNAIGRDDALNAK